jgi:hypothetical protein
MALKILEMYKENLKLQAVAQAAEELMAALGADGEIDTLHPKTQRLLDALYAMGPTCSKKTLAQ